ncbi:MAG: DNA polymerase IV [Candidatus Liptonbacteria bacterium]|nr:DNA polymerase IV [Candidatus Liptonbacteria bacterium]
MRIIAHLDMDAFFAAVEERERPRLRGKPIIVGADPKNGQGRGVVSTANYAAREYGIRSAMPISQAWRLSEGARRNGKPAAVFLEPDFNKYADASDKIIAIAKTYAPLVEQASIDEMYLDLSFSKNYGQAEKIANKIKREIKTRERLTCSIGISPNKLVSKIASDMKKPDGLTIVLPEFVEKFIEPLAIRKIPGIGPKTEELFLKKGVRIVADLKKFSREELGEILGVWGLELYEKVRGRDDSPLIEEREVKSVGSQETFEKDTLDSGIVINLLKVLADEVIGNFKKEGFEKFRRVVVTVRFADFETKTKSRTIKEPADSLETLQFEALNLLMPFFDKRENPRAKKIRLIGIRVEKLTV